MLQWTASRSAPGEDEVTILSEDPLRAAFSYSRQAIRYDGLIAGALRLARNGLVLLGLSAGPLLAQVDGKVIGVVSDRDTAQPLAGAQIVVEGTNLGNVSNADGHYFINQVPVGIQRISSQYLGYVTTTYEERILAGQTSSIDFALPSEVLQAAAIVAIVEREPLVVRDNVVSKSRFTAEEARGLPVDDIRSVITLGAGVYQAQSRDLEGQSGALIGFAGVYRYAGSGYIVRGGRVTESATYVDGVLITDFANQLTVGEVGNFAVEEVDVITGGFGAEFGHAQSGIVNVVTRDGGTERHGSLRFTTDGRFGTDGYDIQERDAFEREACCGFNELQASFGGPVVSDRLTFFGSLEATGAADIDPHAGGFNPAEGGFNSGGSTNTILPGNRGNRTRLQGKLTAFLADDSRLTGTYLFARDQIENYNENRGFFQHTNENTTRLKTYDLILGYDHEIFQTGERNLNLQVRGHFHQTLVHRGTPRNSLSAAAILENGVGEACGDECRVDAHAFDDDFLNYRFGDVEFFFEDSMPSSVFNTPVLSSVGPDPIFGIDRVWFDGGFNSIFSHQNERRYGIRFDLDSQVTRVHRAKAGFEWNWVNLRTRGGDYRSTGGAEVYDVDPRIGAFYVQDRLDFGDLVIDLGLRWDHWNPNTRMPLIPGIVNCEITRFAAIEGCAEDDAPFDDAPTKGALSPRLGVAHPITDATQVRLSYGKFHQLPELQHYFEGHLSDSDFTGNFFRGNPNLDYVETTAFEVGITNLLSENVVLDIVGYNRDRRGAIRADFFPPGTFDPRVLQEIAIFVNADNGNVKGADITLAKRFANYWSTDLTWSLQWARGTTSSPVSFIRSGFHFFTDPTGQPLPPPTELSPEDFDRLHTFNWQFNLGFPPDFRAGTLAGHLLRNLSLYVVYRAHSGEPYTRSDRIFEGFTEDLNASRLPWVHQGDLRLVRGFDLTPGVEIDLFATVVNFLDRRNILEVWADTGRPDQNGSEETESRTPSFPVGFLVEGESPDFPIDLDDVRPEFRDRLARRDLDGNGVISLEEGQESLRRALVSRHNHPYFYGEPRQTRFGVELRF